MNSFDLSKDELECARLFDDAFKKESELLHRLLKHKEELIYQLNSKIKDTDFPDWSIEILLAYNLTLLYRSYIELRSGYLGISQAILRAVVENVALSMYFFEFPEDEKKYRKKRKSFYLKLKQLGYSTWIEGVMERIDKEGKKFTVLDESKGMTWKKFLITNIGDEASSFLHTNIDNVYAMVYGGEIEDKPSYVLGANWLGESVVKNGLWKIIELLIFDTVVFDRVFKEHIEKNDFPLIKEAVRELNKWKKDYNKKQ